MSEELNGVELFKLLTPPQATAGEIAQMSLETLTREVEHRRKRKARSAEISATLTDEQIAQAILDYAHSVPPETRVASSPAEERAACARLLFLPSLCLTFAAILLGIWGWSAWYASGTRRYYIESFKYVLPYVLPFLGVSVFVGLGLTAWAFLSFRPRSRGRTRRTLGLVGISMLLVAILVPALLMPPISAQHLRIQRLAARSYFPGVELARAALTGVDLSGANLRGANLSHADLTGADLSGANLTRANLIGANLTGAGLSGADLTRANLKGANLSGADLSGVNLQTADLRGADLSGADLSGADLRWANLEGAHLSGADLSGANLTRANLNGANLSGADLTGAIVSDAQLSRAASLEHAKMPDGSRHE